MYATLALSFDGRPLELDIECGGDGQSTNSCGLPLYYSHDKVSEKDPDFCYRYASCMNRHSWFFAFPTIQRKFIKVRDIGVLIDDSEGRDPDLTPDPVVIGIMTDDQDKFLEAAEFLRPRLALKIAPDRFVIKQAAPPPQQTRRQRRTAQRQRLKDAKKKGIL